MLTRVTITGADDGVKPAELAALSVEFPWVEWGILFSAKREGTSRYPSRSWRWDLFAAAAPHPMNLSQHLCGAVARDLMAGQDYMLGDAFERIQINGFAAPASGLVELARRPGLEQRLHRDRHRPRESPLSLEFILQVPSAEHLLPAADVARAMGPGRAGVLFNPSGGRGIESWEFPAPDGVHMGYAGGIKPENVVEVLEAIGPMAPDFWIDLESGVRSGGDDRFDLARVRKVLDRVEPFIGTGCDCRPWNPIHDPRPICRHGDCGLPATHLLKHKRTSPRCDHLACAAHAADPRYQVDHDARPLADLFPFAFPRQEGA